MRRVIFILAGLCCTAADAAELLGLKLQPSQGGRPVDLLVALPDSYSESDAPYPAAYLLHGHGGNHWSWQARAGVSELADRHQVVLVMPDAGADSWYLDAGLENFLALELPALMQARFHLDARARGRALLGLSMGGFGALHISLEFPDQFGFVAALSAGVDPSGFFPRWGLDKLGDERFWQQHAITARIQQGARPAVVWRLECGEQDFFAPVNQQLVSLLKEQGIAHQMRWRPGDHSWSFWQTAVAHQLAEFSALHQRSRPIFTLLSEGISKASLESDEKNTQQLLIAFAGWRVPLPASEDWLAAQLLAQPSGVAIAVRGPYQADFSGDDLDVHAIGHQLTGWLSEAPDRRALMVAHSSGAYVAQRLLQTLPAPWLARIRYVNLDGDAGEGHTALTEGVANGLRQLQLVYAQDGASGLVSANAGAMRQLARRYPAARLTAVAARPGVCEDVWCLHQALIVTQPLKSTGFAPEADYRNSWALGGLTTDYLQEDDKP